MWTGFLPGLVLPVLMLILIWFLKSDLALKDFILDFQRRGTLAKALALTGVPNLLLFYIFIWTKRSYAARGVILATLILAGFSLILKFT